MMAYYDSSKTYLSQAYKGQPIWSNWGSNMLEGYARAANDSSTRNPNIAYCRLCIAYKIGKKVSHNDKHWINTYDNNIYEPGVYGWNEINE